jgi:dTDP-4-amino-4,6-dideoxygalactose transaminase
MCSEILTYAQLLQTQEWKSRRKEILKRDGFKCTCCNKAATISFYDHKIKRNVHFQDSGVVMLKTTYDRDGFIQTVEEQEIIPAKNNIILHVHHKYYIHNHAPWNYTDNALITVC